MSSEDFASKPKRPRGRRWQIVTGLAILVVALAVFASQQGGDDDGGGPLNAIAAAAETTQGESGGRATMRSVVSSPSRAEPLEISGQMAFDPEDSRAVLTFRHPATGEPMKMEMVSDGIVVYMRSSIFGPLPDGAEWMALDLAAATGLDRDALMPGGGDANRELELLEATGNVQKLGKEDVSGVPTTHYHGTVSASENAKRLRREGAGDLADRVEEEGAAVQVEAWIDADDLVRRIRVIQTQPGEGAGKPTTIDMRMNFFDFGIDPEIDVPDSGEVFDATSLAKEELADSSGD